ncbi:rod shape-determining protein MreC [Patescibacteria group bacterium]|nr:rod shape-determining protein MreC [Patescibacteria group bacterium]
MKNTHYTIFFTLIIALVFIFFIKPNFINFPFNFFKKITSPIISNYASLAFDINDNSYFFSNFNSLILDNKNLKSENQKLILENIALKDKIKESVIFDESLSYLEQKDYNFEFAKIISKDQFESNTLTIDLGSKNGIDIGYPVVYKNGFLVGKIKEVSEYTSFVSLISKNDSNIASTVLGMDKNLGVVAGDYDLALKFNYVSIDTDISEGDIVITSGIEKYIPYGLVIGEISSIYYNDNDFFQDVYIDPYINNDYFEILSVIIPKK